MRMNRSIHFVWIGVLGLSLLMALPTSSWGAEKSKDRGKSASKAERSPKAARKEGSTPKGKSKRKEGNAPEASKEASASTKAKEEKKGEEGKETASPAEPATPETPSRTGENALDEVSFKLDLARVYRQYHKYEEATKLFKEALKGAPADERKGRILNEFGDLLQEEGKRAEALAAFEQALPLLKNPYERTALYEKIANISQEAGKKEKAIAVLKKMIHESQEPWQRTMARQRLFQIYAEEKRLDAEIEKLQAQLEKHPDDAETLQTLAEVFRDVKFDIDQSTKYYERPAKVKKDDRDVLQRLSECYEQGQKFDKAIALVKRMLEKYPMEKQAWYERLIMLHQQAGQKEKAIEWAEKLAAVMPNDVYAQQRLIDVYLDAGKLEKARKRYEKLLGQQMEAYMKDQVHLHFAYALDRTGHRKEAGRIFTIVANDGSSSEVRTQARNELERFKKEAQSVGPPATNAPASPANPTPSAKGGDAAGAKTPPPSSEAAGPPAKGRGKPEKSR